MDDNIISPSSSPNSIVSSHQNPMAPTLQERLQFILHHRPEWWAYSIFWLPSKDIAGNLVFTWRDGYFRGTRDFVARRCKADGGGGGGAGHLISFGFDEVPEDRMEGGDFTDLQWYG